MTLAGIIIIVFKKNFFFFLELRKVCCKSHAKSTGAQSPELPCGLGGRMFIRKFERRSTECMIFL